MGITADIIDYTEKKEGIFSVGIGNAGISAANKLGMGVGTILLGFSMSMAGFDALKGNAQPIAVTGTINFFFIYFPIIVEAINMVLLLVFFNKKSDIRQSIRS